MSRLTKLALVAVIAAAVVVSAGCVRRVPIAVDTSTTETTATIALGDAQTVDLTLDMGVGSLKVASAASTGTALTGHFVYSPASLRPFVESSTVGAARAIRIYHQTGAGSHLTLGTTRSEWDLTIAQHVPTRLSVRLGVGDGTLDLRGVELTGVSLTQGTGDATVDLSDQRGDLGVNATLGVGQLTLRVPQSARVIVNGHGTGVGEWSAPGFTKQGDSLVNAAYGSSATSGTITIDVQRGVGQVNLVEVP